MIGAAGTAGFSRDILPEALASESESESESEGEVKQGFILFLIFRFGVPAI